MERKLRVTCAIIESGGHILATRRSSRGSMPGKWEFPGGKIEPGETAEACVLREIREELGRDVKILRALAPSTHRYPDFEILLHPFVCRIDEKAADAGDGPTAPSASDLVLRDHSEARWGRPEDLGRLDWAEADLPVLAAYVDFLKRDGGGSGR